MAQRWVLAVHEIAADAAVLWAGTLFPDLPMPTVWRLSWRHADDASGRWRTAQFSSADWRRPFRMLEQRFYRDIKLTGLLPGRRYDAQLERQEKDQSWTVLARAAFDTLPVALPMAGEAPFNVASASCYYREFDGGMASLAFATLCEQGGALRPHVTFLTGDQVYLDVSIEHLSPVMDEVRNRIADEYALNWQGLQGFLSNGATWMLPDDHEYWNNYPRVRGVNPHLWKFVDPELRDAWLETARDGVKRVQRSRPVRTFTIGDDLSFCIADFRSNRVIGSRLMAPEDLTQVLDWARGLQCPGVFVCQQPFFIDEGGPLDYNLPKFRQDYAALLEAFAASGHDILLMCGDSHLGRFSFAKMRGGGVLYEAVSSPLSNLTWLNGLAANTNEQSPAPAKFPAVDIPGFTPQPIRTPRTVSSEFQIFDPRYPKKRTKEHFMTFSFTKQMDGSVMAECNAWLARQGFDPQTGLPVRDFTPGVFVLR